MNILNDHNFKIIEIGFFSVIFNLINGKYLAIENIYLDNEKYMKRKFDELNFFEEKKEFILNKDNIPVITITINLSAKCNLNCSYCFRHESDIKRREISYEESVEFIELIIANYPDTKHFHVDLTGDGEPLLRFDLIRKIIEYTNLISNENRIVKVGLCTNGTLLTKEITEYFEDNDIYYGISIDGDKETNDYFRKGYSEKSVYKSIMKNIRYGKNKYRGAAVTITNRSSDFVSLFKKLGSHFDAMTLKPVREKSIEKGAIDKTNIHSIMNEYTNLYNFILKETLKFNTWYLILIIRDEDLLGKFIRRVILNQSAIVRCGGGINKFSINNTNNIFICGAATGIDEFQIGNLDKGLDKIKMQQLLNNQLERKKCSECWAQYVCGGTCMVHSKNIYDDFSEPDDTICILNKHLIKLAFMFREILIRKHINLFYRIYEVCMDSHYK